MVDQVAPSPSPFEAAIGLPSRAEALPESTEPEVLHVVNATLAQYGPVGLYQIAWQLGAEILWRTGHAFAAHVMSHPHLGMRVAVYRFLCAMLGHEFHGKHGDGSLEVFNGLMKASGEYTGRKLVCSLLTIVRAVRHGTDGSLAPGA